MTVSAPCTSDLLVELADCINALAEQQLALREELSALLPVVDDLRGQWSSPSQVEPVAPLPQRPKPMGPLTAATSAVAEPATRLDNPTAEAPLVRVVSAWDLRRDYNYFDDLDASVAQLRADGESREADATNGAE